MSFIENPDDVSDKVLQDLARMTEAAERFEDMCTIMRILVERKSAKKEALKVDERNMLSVAYKNVVGQRRASWRLLKGEEEFLGDREDLKDAYRKVVEKELEDKCTEVLTLLENNLVLSTVPKIEESDDDKAIDEKTFVIETQVFYLKMCGDYYRYLAEFVEQVSKDTNTVVDEVATDGKKDYKQNAIDKYEAALALAKISLKPTHPTRLGLALNASVCYFEIFKQPKKACDLAKNAFDLAIQKLDSLSDSTYKDSTLIMQLLRDNLTIWSSEEKNPEIEDQDD